MKYNKYPKDLLGLRFGLLVVRQLTDKRCRKQLTWLCQCDCGQEVVLPRHSLVSGNTKSCGCNQYKHGEQHYKWKGGRRKHTNGYVHTYGPEHQNAYGKKRRLYEHVLVMSNHLGRPLLPGESVHHKNGVRDDNRLENLELWSGSQPAGQRVSDKVAWAKELLRLYEPGALAHG